MTISRREAIRISGATLAGLSIGTLARGDVWPQAPANQVWPDDLVERPTITSDPALERNGGR